MTKLIDQKINRVIVIDTGKLVHSCIFNYSTMIQAKKAGKMAYDQWIPNPDYIYFRSLIAILKRITIKKNDIVIIANDARHSWRKAFLTTYKKSRKDNRAKAEEINWEEWFSKIDDTNQKLAKGTDWYFIKFSDFITYPELCETPEGQKFLDPAETDSAFGMEADDILAFCSAYFKDQEVILVTGDGDIDQLAYNKNTKIFSLNIKKSASEKGFYKVIDNPLEVLAKKIRKGDASDEITEDDNPEVKDLIINLLKLPEFIYNTLKYYIEQVPFKQNIDYSELPYPNSLGSEENFSQIYLPDKEVTYEESVKLNTKLATKKKAKAKIAYEKRKAQKDLEKERQMR